MSSDGTVVCPDDQIWVCCRCGKRSRTRYGFIDDGSSRGGDHLPDGSRVAQPGWDESCTMNAVLCYVARAPDGAWRAVPRIESVVAAEVTSCSE